MPQEKQQRYSKQEKDRLTENANNRLTEFVNKAIGMEIETPNEFFMLHEVDSNGISRRALVVVDNDEVYSEDIFFWPETEDGILGTSVLAITDYHEGADGSYVPLVYRETGKFTVESVSVFDSKDQINKEVKNILFHLKTGSWYKGFLSEIDAAKFIENVDLNSFRRV